MREGHLSPPEHYMKQPIIPARRTTGQTLKERMSENAYDRILPARYLRKDEDGNLIETQEELFDRVAGNIALAEIPHFRKGRKDTLYVSRDGVPMKVTEKSINRFTFEEIEPHLTGDEVERYHEVKEDFRNLMENLDFVPNTPTLMNAGDELQQLSACFVMSPEDDIDDIHDKARKAALVFQSGGGCGYSFSRLRPYGDVVGSTGGIASGPITFMRTYDQMCETIAQGGARRGAQMGILRVDHPDIIEFIHAKNKDVSLAHSLRLNDPDDPEHVLFSDALEEARELIDDYERVPKHLRNAVEGHLSNFNVSVAVTDAFMKAVKGDTTYDLINPRTGRTHVSTKHTVEMWSRYGLEEYVTEGEPLQIPAKLVWERIAEGAHQNGEPGVVFIDRINQMHSFDVEKYPEREILATNPCGEQPLMEYEACLAGNVPIATSTGIRKISDHKDWQIVTSVERKEPVVADSTFINQGTKDTVIVTLDGGMEIECTPDHVFITDVGEVEAQDLVEKGASVEWQYGNPFVSSVKMDEDAWEAFTLGWMHGDGWCTENSVGISFNNADGDFEVKDKVLSVYHDLFGQRKPIKDDEVSYQEQIDTQEALETADEFGFTKAQARFRTLPEWFWTASSYNQQIAFLRGLFTADSGIGGKAKNQIHMATQSITLAKEIQQVLGTLGIQSRRYTTEFKTENRNPQHRVTITKESARRFMKVVGLETSVKQDAFQWDTKQYKDASHLEVLSVVDSEGSIPVYDLNVPSTNTFYAAGVHVHNCNLGHINLSTLKSEGVDVWDGEEDLGDYLNEAIDWEEFDRRIHIGTRFLDNVVTMSKFPVEEIEEMVKSTRKIGLGVMGLAQLLIQLGVSYDSAEASFVCVELMTHLNYVSKEASHQLALEKGSFSAWSESKYADPMQYEGFFGYHVGQKAEEWREGFPIRNHNTTTIAPTGTTGMIANTSGGCEPIYSVAHFKNVSDDVQGDEMLVEFDDYFLDVLRANDIDVEDVKLEAVTQMNENRFDGVNGLTELPQSIRDLFVVTADIPASQHAKIQTACQRGVDSAISKTINAPPDATVEDTMSVFEQVYDDGGKGVTYYRDGSRSKQVLTTRKDNAKFSEILYELDDDVEWTQEMIDVFVELQKKNEFSPDDGITVLEDGTRVAEVSMETPTLTKKGRELFGKMNAEPTDIEEPPKPSERSLKENRPSVLPSETHRVQTGYGNLYVTVTLDENDYPFEVFATIGNSGGFTSSFVEAIGKLCSVALRSGVDAEVIADKLCGIRSPEVGWDNGEQIQSVPDGIGKAILRSIKPDIPKTNEKKSTTTTVKDIVDAGHSPECPECGDTLIFQSGCKECTCGWSQC